MTFRLVEPDASWPARFEAEASALRELLAPWLSDGIHHIGSTSIPGLAAKPCIDMMAGVASFDDAAAAIPVLEAAGWIVTPHRPQTHHFDKRVGRTTTHALHLLETNHPLWSERLAFRDALRGDDALRYEYARIKREQAALHPDDLGAYTHGKAEFVIGVLERSGIGFTPWRT